MLKSSYYPLEPHDFSTIRARLMVSTFLLISMIQFFNFEANGLHGGPRKEAMGVHFLRYYICRIHR